jgi:hypothetical protein
MTAQLTTKTQLVVTTQGIDANGNAVNNQTTVATTSNTGAQFAAASPLTLQAGLNSFSTQASAYGYTMMTIVPPPGNANALYLGQSEAGGTQVAPGSPIMVGITGITGFAIFVGGSTAGIPCSILFS